jgi:DNA-directed RNA polymerase beta' subunit
MLQMIEAGSKGSYVNYNQVTTSLGQQIDFNGRIEPRLAKGTRTYPHFNKYDQGLRARGHVRGCFIKGLNPTEFFAHAQASRISLTDTSCKTAKTGYTNRKLIKSLERLQVIEARDGSKMVINMSSKQVLQFKYGSDNIDPTYKL